MLFVGNSSYIHAKEGCYTCGRGDQLVSTEVSIEGEGVLVLCKGCITDAARAGGIDVEPREVIDGLKRELEAAYDDAAAENAQRVEVEARLARLQNEWVAAVEHEQAAKASASA